MTTTTTPTDADLLADAVLALNLSRQEVQRYRIVNDDIYLDVGRASELRWTRPKPEKGDGVPEDPRARAGLPPKEITRDVTFEEADQTLVRLRDEAHAATRELGALRARSERLRSEHRKEIAEAAIAGRPLPSPPAVMDTELHALEDIVAGRELAIKQHMPTWKRARCAHLRQQQRERTEANAPDQKCLADCDAEIADLMKRRAAATERMTARARQNADDDNEILKLWSELPK